MSTEENAVFDVAQFELEDFATLEILNKKGDPMLVGGKPVTFDIYGPGSSQAVAWENKQNRDMMNRAVAAARGKAKDVDVRKEMAEKLAAVTKAVNNFPVDGGALAIYQNAKLSFIADQVARFHADTANF